MICKKCGSIMGKNGVRGTSQRYECNCGWNSSIKLTDNILVIPDLHIPFEHKNALRFVSDLSHEYNCSKIVQIGDLTDQYCFSRYARDPDAMSTREEVYRAKEKIKDWKSIFPTMLITEGNHCKRLQKRIYEIGIPADMVLQTTKDIFGMPETWYFSHEFEINDVIYMHGCKTGEYAHVNSARDYRKSTVIGHTHSSLAVDWMAGVDDRIFGCNCGCLIDQHEYAFFYAREMSRRPVLGAVVMIDGKYPLTVPMN